MSIEIDKESLSDIVTDGTPDNYKVIGIGKVGCGIADQFKQYPVRLERAVSASGGYPPEAAPVHR